MSEARRLETLAVHAGRVVDPATGAVTPAIYPSTTFERDADGGYPRGHLYARNSNPTRSMLEECLRQLDGGEAAVAFASGSAATAAIFMALTPGDHVIAPTDAYYGTQRLLREQFGPWGLEYSLVDMTDPGQAEAARASSHAPHLGGNALQSPVEGDGYRAAGQHRAPGWGQVRVRQHRGHARAPAPAQPRSRSGHVRHDQVPRRALGRHGWRSGHP